MISHIATAIANSRPPMKSAIRVKVSAKTPENRIVISIMVE